MWQRTLSRGRPVREFGGPLAQIFELQVRHDYTRWRETLGLYHPSKPTLVEVIL